MVIEVAPEVSDGSNLVPQCRVDVADPCCVGFEIKDGDRPEALRNLADGHQFGW
jgi:hypothetical protein